MTTTRAPRTGPTSVDTFTDSSRALAPTSGRSCRSRSQAGGLGSTAPPDDTGTVNLAALQTAFASAATPGAFASSQEPIVVGQTAYNTTYNTTFPATWPKLGYLEDLRRRHQLPKS